MNMKQKQAYSFVLHMLLCECLDISGVLSVVVAFLQLTLLFLEVDNKCMAWIYMRITKDKLFAVLSPRAGASCESPGRLSLW